MKNAAALFLILGLAAQATASRVIVDCPVLTTLSNTTVTAKFYNDSLPACGLECNATMNQIVVECALHSCTGYVHTFTVNTTLEGNYSLLFFNGSTNASCWFIKPVSKRQPVPDLSPATVAAAVLMLLFLLRKTRQRY